MESFPDGTQKLTMFNVTKDDTNAEIRCAAINKWGKFNIFITFTQSLARKIFKFALYPDFASIEV